jgi:hypothetical protein
MIENDFEYFIFLVDCDQGAIEGTFRGRQGEMCYFGSIGRKEEMFSWATIEWPSVFF